MMRELNHEIRKWMSRRGLGSTTPAMVQQTAKCIPSVWKKTENISNMTTAIVVRSLISFGLSQGSAVFVRKHTSQVHYRAGVRGDSVRQRTNIWARTGMRQHRSNVRGIFPSWLCSTPSVITRGAVKFTFYVYEWIIDGWLPLLLWKSVQARMLMLQLMQVLMKDAL